MLADVDSEIADRMALLKSVEPQPDTEHVGDGIVQEQQEQQRELSKAHQAREMVLAAMKAMNSQWTQLAQRNGGLAAGNENSLVNHMKRDLTAILGHL